MNILGGLKIELLHYNYFPAITKKLIVGSRYNYNKNQEKSNFRSTEKNYNIDSYSYGDQTDSESDDCERLSEFVDSELISDSDNDDWIPKVVIITRI